MKNKAKKKYSLRVSVTQQCQYRCPYCIPSSSISTIKKNDWISLNEYSKILKYLNLLNIEKVRFTGGEPLLRPDIFDIIEVFSKQMKKTKLAITTNAYLFKKKMSQMKKSGIYSVNIHIDSLIHNKYRYITKRNALDKILESISFGKEKFKNIKINSVIQNGFNDDEIIDFLNFSKKNKIQVRFLELMNTGLSSRYIKNKFFSKAELLKRISLFGNVEKIGRKNPEDPAVLYEFVPMKVIFGIIASETEKFCFNCNRLRLSANGDIFNCLYQKEKFPILNLIKNKYDNDYIFNKFFSFVGKKKSFHPSITSGRNFSMSEIGG